MNRFVSILFVVLTTLSAQAEDKVRVSSFSTVLTEIVAQVGGDRVTVTGHVKPGVDPHQFELKPADLKIVSAAHLVLLSAKHMESYVDKLKESAAAKGAVVEVGAGFASLKMKDDHGHDHGDEDPHWWHSVAHVRKATRIVRDALVKTSPGDKAAFSENAAKYVQRLDALERWVKSEVAKLARDRRKLVTSHDAFQYFAKEYGFTIYAIEGTSAAEQPSSQRVAQTIATIKAQGVKAIFAEDFHNPKVLQEITRETGAVLGGELAADGLGTGATSTYEGMIRHNVSTIVSALK